MLPKLGQTLSFEAAVGVVMLVVAIVAALFVAAALSESFFTPGEDGVKSLTARIDSIALGGLQGLDIENEELATQYAASLFYYQATDRGHALILFDGSTDSVQIRQTKQHEQAIEQQSDGLSRTLVHQELTARTLVEHDVALLNPCGGDACLCEYDMLPFIKDPTVLPEQINCYEFEYAKKNPATQVDIVTIKQPVSVDRTTITGRRDIAESDLYGYEIIQEAYTPDPVIWYVHADVGGSDNANILLYLEYVPASRGNPPVILITPLDDRHQSRWTKLRRCPEDSGTCADYAWNAPIPGTGDYCARRDGTCVQEPAPACGNGPIRETCSCGGVSYNTGFCLHYQGRNALHFSEETLDCPAIREARECEAYCEGADCAGGTPRSEVTLTACTMDYCQLGQPCAPTGDSCSVEGDQAERLALAAKLLDGASGYKYTIVKVNPEFRLFGYPSDLADINFGDQPTMRACTSPGNCERAAVTFATNVGLCGFEEACICTVEAAAMEQTGNVMRLTNPTCHGLGLEEDIIVMGSSDTLQIDIPGAAVDGRFTLVDENFAPIGKFPALHQRIEDNQKDNQNYLLVERYNDPDGFDIVRVSPWTTNSRHESFTTYRLCTGDKICPPSLIAAGQEEAVQRRNDVLELGGFPKPFK